MKLLKILK